MNKLLTIGILAGGGLLAYRAFQLNALAGNITTRLTGVRVHQLNFSGLTLAVGVAINNPTKSTVKISKPVVVLTSNSQYVGESDADGKAFTVAAQKVSSIGEIFIKIPLTSAMTLFKGINLTSLFAAFKGTSLQAAAQSAMAQIKMPIEAQISFYADSLFVKLPATPRHLNPMPTLHIPYRPDDREISAGQRTLRTDGTKYNQYFPAPKSEDKVVFEDGEVDDTLKLMERVIHTYLDDTAEIAQHLRKDGLADTINSIWDFLYYNVQYKLDKQGLEQLRRPARSWAERYTGIDCDCFSIFASSILTNLGIQHSLRVTRYSQPTWQHVYVVIPKDGKSLTAGYYTLDAVLARADYEKPFTAKKDYKMSLSGINIAVLSGIDGGDESGVSATDILMGFEDATAVPIGSTADINAPHYENELYKFLLATRQTIDAAPEAYIEATGGNPSDMVKMLDYAIQYWYTDKRDAALGQLEKNEETLNILNGFGAFNHVELTGFNESELYGDDDAHEIAGLGRTKGKQRKPSKFFSGIKKAVKKVNIGKALVRFNPATIAIRNGYLLALKLNIGKMSEKMKWAYATPQQAAAKRISPAHVAAAKNAVAKVEKMFSKLGGKPENMRKAILHAKKGHLSGHEQLGVVPLAAGLAAAIPFIKVVMDVLKKSGLVKPGEKAELTPDGEVSTQADRMISTAETGIQLFTKDDGDTDESATALSPATTDTEYTPAEVVMDSDSETGVDGLGSIFGTVGDFFRGNPGLALALTAGGAYILYSATTGGSRASPGVAGLGSLHSHQKAPPKKKAASKVPVYRLH